MTYKKRNFLMDERINNVSKERLTKLKVWHILSIHMPVQY
jgi:hypothetical protein